MNITKTTSLYNWAEGSLPLQASVYLLTNALDGHLLDGPWVRRRRDDGYWFDAERAVSHSGYLSGGQRRVLLIAASLADSAHPVDLHDTTAGLDASSFVAVVQALGVAVGLNDTDDTDDSHRDSVASSQHDTVAGVVKPYDTVADGDKE